MASLSPPSHLPSARDCVRCGLCLESCPTYVELAAEADSPRGRIAIMRALDEGRLPPAADALLHLDLCLDCRACETACPSGVRYGTLIETARARYASAPRGRRRLRDRIHDSFAFNVLPDRNRLRRWLKVARLLDGLGLPSFLEASGLSRRLGLPHWPRRVLARGLAEGGVIPSPRGTASAPAANGRPAANLFEGCVSAVLTPQTNRATIRVLEINGCTVNCPSGQTCCGAIHHHAGRIEEARRLARINIESFEAQTGEIVNNVAGCGAMLRQYGELLSGDAAYRDRAASFASRVRDISEFLVRLPLVPPTTPLPRRVVYHDPCHLCHAQQIREAPRAILRMIPGLELVPLAESDMCCGAAGTYTLTQPDMSARLARRKWRNLSAARPDVIATANIGCALQIEQHPPDGCDIPVRHVVELLSDSYGAHV